MNAVDDGLASATNAWRAGAMSTLDYLLAVNARAGRFRGAEIARFSSR